MCVINSDSNLKHYKLEPLFGINSDKVQWRGGEGGGGEVRGRRRAVEEVRDRGRRESDQRGERAVDVGRGEKNEARRKDERGR